MSSHAERNNLVCPNCHMESLLSHDVRRFICKSCGHITPRNAKLSAVKWEPVEFKRLFITCAVEGQPLHSKALEVVQRYCKVTGAELVILPRDYYFSQPRVMRPTQQRPSIWKKTTKKRMYAKAIIPLLRRPDWLLNNNLVLRGSAHISPTNQNVLSGKAPLARSHSLILGHPQQAREDYYAGKKRGVASLYTTGAITRERYSASEVGDKAEFHHVLGGLIVEINNESTFYARHVGFAKDGSFIDLDTKWTASGPKAAPRLKALVFGDLHCAERDKRVFDKQFESGGLVPTLNPEYIIEHDAIDGFFVNHHKSIFEMAAGHETLRDTADEINEYIELHQRLCDAYPNTQFVAVGSNHTDWFTQWAAKECKSTRRAVLLLHSQLRAWILSRSKPSRMYDAMDFVSSLIDRSNFRNLHSSDQLELLGCEMSLHGHRGPLGARGNINTFAKLGTKGISGHRHQAGRKLGWMVVGTCGPTKGGYRDPIDAATRTHGLLYSTGKRTLTSHFSDAFYMDWRK